MIDMFQQLTYSNLKFEDYHDGPLPYFTIPMECAISASDAYVETLCGSLDQRHDIFGEIAKEPALEMRHGPVLSALSVFLLGLDRPKVRLMGKDNPVAVPVDVLAQTWMEFENLTLSFAYEMFGHNHYVFCKKMLVQQILVKNGPKFSRYTSNNLLGMESDTPMITQNLSTVFCLTGEGDVLSTICLHEEDYFDEAQAMEDLCDPKKLNFAKVIALLFGTSDGEQFVGDGDVYVRGCGPDVCEELDIICEDVEEMDFFHDA